MYTKEWSLKKVTFDDGNDRIVVNDRPLAVADFLWCESFPIV